ncbi:hypothetical protein SVAN01_11844 [Stagonosporopsis vannaccii]|nr:hypothetical protein SVAN01_11844 [Stagonosporopsis vannaccii]
MDSCRPCKSQSLACAAACILRRGGCGELRLTSAVQSSSRPALAIPSECLKQRSQHRRMGNQHSSSSRSTPASSQPQSPVGSSNGPSHAHAHGHPDKHHLPHPGFRTGRRASIQPVTLTQVAPPSASFESAERGRASTQANTTAHVTSQLRAAQDRSIARDEPEN